MMWLSKPRSGLLYTILVGICAYFLFLATSAERLFPGESARQVAMALHLEPNTIFIDTVAVPEDMRPLAPITPGMDPVSSEIVSSPPAKTGRCFRTKQALWRLLSTYVAHMPGEDALISARLNNLCALLGAICVALVFFLGRGMILIDTLGAIRLPMRTRKIAANYAGLASAIIFATSIPFWLASTHCSPYPFDVLLLLLISCVLFRVAVNHDPIMLFVFGVLCSLNIFEWHEGLFMAPLFIFFAIRSASIGRINTSYGIALMLAGMLIGSLLYFIACHLALPGQGISLSLIIHELTSSIRYGLNLLTGGIFTSNAMLSSFCLAILPYLAIVAMLFCYGEGALVCYFALACLFALCSINAPFSPWGTARLLDGDTLPVLSYLLNSALGAYLIGKCALLTNGTFLVPDTSDQPPDGVDEFSSNKSDSPSGRLLFWVLSVLIIFCALWNFTKILDEEEDFLDCVAEEVAHDLHDQTLVLMEDNNLDSLLRIHAYRDGKGVMVCNPFGQRAQLLFQTALNSRIHFFENLRENNIRSLTRSLATTNITAFIQEWVAVDTGIATKLLVMHPETIVKANKKAVPALIGFHAIASGAEPDWRQIAERHIDFYNTLARTAPLYPQAPEWLRSSHSEIREQIAFVGECLSKQLKEKGYEEMSRQVLAAAQTIEEPVESISTPNSHLFF